MFSRPILFSGSSHHKLMEMICENSNVVKGTIHLEQFPDGETHVQIAEDVKGKSVFILQSTAGDPNHYLLEMLIIIDALKRASARKITAIIPYLAYCRQDRKDQLGTPITAKLIANILTAAGINNLITFDMHADQVEGFYEIPVEHLRSQVILDEHLKEKVGRSLMIVAPDVGSIKIAERMAKHLGTDLAVMKKERLSSQEVRMTLIGDVLNRDVLVVDDVCSTGGTLVEAARICRLEGAKTIVGSVCHGLFVGDAVEKIERSEFEKVFVTNTINLDWISAKSHKIEVVDISSSILGSILSATS